MSIFKKVMYLLLSIALTATIALSIDLISKECASGRYSAVTTITDKSRQWLLDQFGHYQTVPELLKAIDDFGCENFVYENYPVPLVQAFDLEKFLFDNNFHGVCFEFSCFVKCAVLVWQEAHQRQDVQAFVYDVRVKAKGGHSYNFIMEDGHTWFICLTSNHTLVTEGRESLGIIEITGMSPTEYAASYEEIVYRFY